MSTDVDYDEDWTWPTPVPDGAMHAMADIDGDLPCCDRTVGSLVLGEGMTADPARVTCKGASA